MDLKDNTEVPREEHHSETEDPSRQRDDLLRRLFSLPLG